MTVHGLGVVRPLEPLPTASERAAEALREGIFEGRFAPGTPLTEVALAGGFRVSRATVREALRLLAADGLVRLEPHKGATVRSLGPDDVHDLYASRRVLELGAVDALAAGEGGLPPAAFTSSLAAGDAAAAAGDWRAVGTADLRFHAELVAVHGSARCDEFFRRLVTELRLGFLALPDPAVLHRPYLRRNHELARLLLGGEYTKARAALSAYLDDAAGEVGAAVAAE